MSDALAISAVTAALQYWLTQVFGSSPALSSVTVSAKAPDIVQTEIAAGGAQLRVNLFLHQVTHNAALRNLELPVAGRRRSDAAVEPAARPGPALPDDRLRDGGLRG